MQFLFWPQLLLLCWPALLLLGRPAVLQLLRPLLSCSLIQRHSFHRQPSQQDREPTCALLQPIEQCLLLVCPDLNRYHRHCDSTASPSETAAAQRCSAVLLVRHLCCRHVNTSVSSGAEYPGNKQAMSRSRPGRLDYALLPLEGQKGVQPRGERVCTGVHCQPGLSEIGIWHSLACNTHASI